MPTFHPVTPDPSALTSRQLHPAGEPAAAVADDVLVEIAAGLARTVPAAEIGPGRTVLLVTPAYEAAVEVIEAGGCQLVVGAAGEPVSVAVVAGRLMAWTADERSHLVSPGGLFSLVGGEGVQLVNVGADRAVLVSVQGLSPAVEEYEGGPSTFSPCPSLAG